MEVTTHAGGLRLIKEGSKALKGALYGLRAEVLKKLELSAMLLEV